MDHTDASHDAAPAPFPTPARPTVVKPAAAATRVAAAGGAIANLDAGFRSELQKIYGQFTDHVGKRDPDNLSQRGYDQDTEDKLERLFNMLAYGGQASIARTKLTDARTLLTGALKRVEGPEGNDDKDCRDTLKALEQLLSEAGF